MEDLTVIQPTRGLAALQLRAVWQYRELLLFLAWRDIKVRTKQTVLGVARIMLQPLLSTVVFALLFGGLLKAPSSGARRIGWLLPSSGLASYSGWRAGVSI